MYDKNIDTEYVLEWTDWTHSPLSEVMNDETLTGSGLVSSLTLINNETEEEIDSRCLVISDDDPEAEEKVNGEFIYRDLEDTLLTIHNIARASATSVNVW